jgi:outer membrane biogenesis lipoprotein LolB
MKHILMTAALLLLAACDPTSPPQPETERQPNPVFETQIQAVEKARAVEGQLEAAAAAQRRQLDAATQP